MAPEFLVTKEYRRFAEFCDACRRYRYIGLCYGPPGVGKTLSARHYARWDLLEPAVARPFTAVPPEAVACRSVVYTPTVDNTPRQVGQEVRRLTHDLSLAVWLAQAPDPDTAAYPHRLADVTQLVLVDEADRLKMPGLEQLRDVYDRGALGLVLIGMPGLEKRLARYPQLYSRVGFVHQFRPLSADELRFILAHHWARLGQTLSPDDFTDAEALAAVARITGGNFRLVQRLFAQIERVLQINALRTVTKEVVETARESLVIGSL